MLGFASDEEPKQVRRERKLGTKRTPPPETESARVYTLEEVASQFLYRLGGLDAVYFHPPGHPPETAWIDPKSNVVEMSARLGGHVSTVKLKKQPYAARDVGAVCEIIFSELRLAIRGKPAVA